ncbi:MAG: cell envelope integrity protein TolA [Pseudomonadota bacterium]
MDTGRVRQIREHWGGIGFSLLLHGALLLAVLWYLANRPQIQDRIFRALPVDLVIGGTLGQGRSAPAARLQTAKPQADSSPVQTGTRPDSIRKPVDAMTARLQALAQLKGADTALPNADAGGASGSGGGEGNYALRDFIRAQILRRWLPDLSIAGGRNLPVLVRVRLLRSGVIDDVTVVDQARFHSDGAFRDMALSAQNAARLASPIQLPPGRYERVTVLTIDLDPKAVLR